MYGLLIAIHVEIVFCGLMRFVCLTFIVIVNYDWPETRVHTNGHSYPSTIITMTITIIHGQQGKGSMTRWHIWNSRYNCSILSWFDRINQNPSVWKSTKWNNVETRLFRWKIEWWKNQQARKWTKWWTETFFVCKKIIHLVQWLFALLLLHSLLLCIADIEKFFLFFLLAWIVGGFPFSFHTHNVCISQSFSVFAKYLYPQQQPCRSSNAKQTIWYGLWINIL